MTFLSKITQIALTLTPSFINKFVRSYFLDQEIDRTAKISFGSLVVAKSLCIGRKTRVHSAAILIGQTVRIGQSSTIKPLSICKTHSITIGDYCHIAPLAVISGPQIDGAELRLGDHSRIFPFCWIETGEGVFIGKHVGVGGHTLIFTHGAWSNFLKGGPVNFASVHIEDDVWLPWRVFVMPGVHIGQGCIIGANSVVTKSIPKNCLAVGTPANVIKENVHTQLSYTEQQARVELILQNFVIFMKRSGKLFTMDGNSSVTNDYGNKVSTDESLLSKGDIYISINSPNSEVKNKLKDKGINLVDLSKLTYIKNSFSSFQETLIPFLRRYGIRLSS